MIPVTPAAEPPHFHERVRKPGRDFLQAHPHPKASEWRPFWNEVGADMQEAYNNLCAYSAFRLDGSGTIDHFRPKSKYPDLAYEWENYRLCSAKINSCKGDREDVADPFHLPRQAFFIDFVDGSISVNPAAFSSAAEAELAEQTITRLHLNSKVMCNSRRSIFWLYLKREVEGRWLAPFVYDEMLRQNLLPNT